MTSRAAKISFVLSAMLLLVAGLDDGRVAVAAVSDDDRLPLAQLQSLGHSDGYVAKFQGKPVLLQFWASWCHSCSSIMFDLDKLLKLYPDTDYLAVSMDEERDDALQYIQKHALYKKYNDHFFLDYDKILATKLGVETVPTVILFDAERNEVVRRSGHLNSNDLLQLSAGMKSIAESHSGEIKK